MRPDLPGGRGLLTSTGDNSALLGASALKGTLQKVERANQETTERNLTHVGYSLIVVFLRTSTGEASRTVSKVSEGQTVMGAKKVL